MTEEQIMAVTQLLDVIGMLPSDRVAALTPLPESELAWLAATTLDIVRHAQMNEYRALLAKRLDIVLDDCLSQIIANAEPKSPF